MTLQEKKKNLDMVAEHFKKFPEVLKAIQSCPENMEWIMGCDNMEEAVETEKESMSETKPISSMDELRKKAKDKMPEEVE